MHLDAIGCKLSSGVIPIENFLYFCQKKLKF